MGRGFMRRVGRGFTRKVWRGSFVLFVLFYVKTLKDPWIRKWPSSNTQDLSIGLDLGHSTLF